MSERHPSKPDAKAMSRRAFLWIGSVGLATATLASLPVDAQEKRDIPKAEDDQSAIKASNKEF
jgi:hypothetical protein